MAEPHAAWTQLMSAAERLAHLAPQGEASTAIEQHLAELEGNCPGFLHHEYRQAYWQGLQNVRQHGDADVAAAAH
jgi:hypothetical protein